MKLTASEELDALVMALTEKCQRENTYDALYDDAADAITTLRAQLAAETARADRAEAERAAQIEADGWQPIETAPSQDGALHVRGVWVHSAITGKKMYFDACAGYLESGDFLSADGEDHGWRPEDYTHWMPLPEPLEAASRAIRAQPHDRTALDAAIRAAKVEAWREAADKLKGQGYNTAVRQILALIGEGV